MKNLVLIGGSSSLGGDICEIFTRENYKVYASYFSNNKKTSTLKNLEFHHLDLTNSSSIKNFSEFLVKKNIKIDVLISLAGIIPGKNLAEYSDIDLDLVSDVNFLGQIKLLKKLLPLITNKSRLIFLSSISAQKGSYDPIYAASKGAILSFVKSMLLSLPPGSTINAIAPGLIDNSSMFNKMDFEIQKMHAKTTHTGKFLNINDLSKIIFDLCQDHWKHLNGACIDLNGGQYLR